MGLGEEFRLDVSRYGVGTRDMICILHKQPLDSDVGGSQTTLEKQCFTLCQVCILSFQLGLSGS